MSDEFFRKTFGDSQSVHLGSGWVSGVSAVFLGLLGLGAVLCLRFPALLTLPEARAHYPMGDHTSAHSGNYFRRLRARRRVRHPASAQSSGAHGRGSRRWPRGARRRDASRFRRRSQPKSESAWTGSCWTCLS